jgi:hypothetical protein
VTARHFNPRDRGNYAIYRECEVNRCPGCGRTHWIVGRVTAECAFCATALPLDVPESLEAPSIRTFGRGGGRVKRMMAFA